MAAWHLAHEASAIGLTYLERYDGPHLDGIPKSSASAMQLQPTQLAWGRGCIQQR